MNVGKDYRDIKNLIKQYDNLQKIYGSENLNSVYGCGEDKHPRVALVFMNPTKRNIATNKSWTGIRAQWLGTKQIWDFLTKCDLFSKGLNSKIKVKQPKDWSPDFCQQVYDEVKKQGLWITNLAKCSQEDARELPDNIFKQYKGLLEDELAFINPQKIFLFGNQVASIMLDKKITVSTVRQQKFNIKVKNKIFDCFAIYYPVGNGRFNQDKAIEDVKNIIKK